MWYNEKFVYYSNSPGFYGIYFLGKKLFWCYTMYNWDVKIPGKEKKTIIVRNTNLVWCLLDCLFCLSKLLLVLLPWWFSPPPLLPTLPSTTGSTLGIARNFTHRSELCASLYRNIVLHARTLRTELHKKNVYSSRAIEYKRP